MPILSVTFASTRILSVGKSATASLAKNQGQRDRRKARASTEALAPAAHQKAYLEPLAPKKPYRKGKSLLTAIPVP